MSLLCGLGHLSLEGISKSDKENFSQRILDYKKKVLQTFSQKLSNPTAERKKQQQSRIEGAADLKIK